MRVVYVNHTSRISGGEHSLLALLGALPGDVEAAVACPEGPLSRRVRQLGVEVLPICGTEGSLRLHPTGTPRALLDMSRAARQVRRAAAGAEADLLHANSIRAGIIATGASRGLDLPTIVHVRDCLPEGRLAGVSRWAISRADSLIANSQYTRSTLGEASATARVIHNAVDLERFQHGRLTRTEARLRLGLSNARPVLAVIAQITPWKAQDDAIEIAARLVGSYPSLRLLLVGSPKFTGSSTRYDNAAFFDSLRQRVTHHGLDDHVLFLGERDDIPQILSAIDVLLAPSWEEPFGRTVVEAMALGVPVAATNVGGPREILEEQRCGLLLPPRKPRLWADELSFLLSDPTRRSEMAVRGEAVARRRFALDRHVGEVVEVYEELAPAAAAV